VAHSAVARLRVLDVVRRPLDASYQLAEPLAALTGHQGDHLVEGRVARAEVVQPSSITVRQSSALPREEQLADRPAGGRQAHVEEKPSDVQGVRCAVVLSRAEAPLEVPVLAPEPGRVLAVEALLEQEDALRDVQVLEEVPLGRRVANGRRLRSRPRTAAPLELGATAARAGVVASDLRERRARPRRARARRPSGGPAGARGRAAPRTRRRAPARAAWPAPARPPPGP